MVSAGFTEQDDLLAVGVVPIAVTNWWGDQPFGVWPWALPKLGGAQPEVLDLADGIQIDQDRRAETRPHRRHQRRRRRGHLQEAVGRSRRPFAQSGQDAFFEPWKDQAATIGQAVFKFDEMAALVKAVDDKFTEIAKNNPQFSGKKALLLEGTIVDDAVHVPTPRLAQRLPHPDGLDDPRHRRHDHPRPDGCRCSTPPTS